MKDKKIMDQSKSLIYKNLVSDATQFALKGDWKKAISTNKEILSLNKLDVQALNRIGKAHLELGKLKESKKSYTKALQIDPLNTIARRNLKELEQMKDEKTLQGKVQNKSNLEKLVRNDILIQTAARSAEFIIDKPNSRVIKNLVPGTELLIIASENGVEITNTRKVALGTIEPRSALRLKTCIDGGSQFEVIFKDFFGNSGVIQILETYREPSVALETPFINSIIDDERSKILADVMLYSEDENSELGLEDNWESIDMSDDDETVEEENLQDGFQTIDTTATEDEEDEEEIATDQIEEAKDEEIDEEVIDVATSDEGSEEKSDEATSDEATSDEGSEEKSDE
ncbi:MAG: hypothetical protein CL779_01720 [Chloroflexi bacterium]|nr:hypothetical protein [Chloroflexota bacterium]